MAVDDSKSKKKKSSKSSEKVDSAAVKEKEEKSRPKKTEEQPLDDKPKDDIELSDKKRKKRKRGIETEERTAVVEETPAPPKKKHKNRTEFADPRVDESLSTQARKGLEYAFLQMNKPAKWKFNKARQNWLIRNIWSPENVIYFSTASKLLFIHEIYQIPELYMPLLCKYLSNVQGGSREKLKSSCQSALNPEVPKPDTEAPKPAEDEDEKEESASPTETKRKVTFGPLIATSTPAPQATDSSSVPVTNPDASKLVEINHVKHNIVTFELVDKRDSAHGQIWPTTSSGTKVNKALN
ncbi:hypothetical protein CVT24_009099 [Panaeolus cyanescens]|uniref:WKF domain-containing protein n=1 Tax=Panaeolus cyanescens TaxID=181874 RepID=A0A409VAQ3_9AGAR|nr:hypothetical protein CVT24_009099 [Panaeolus cyanescens]